MTFPGKPITSIEEYNERNKPVGLALRVKQPKPKESRVVTIERFETFLFELHRVMRTYGAYHDGYPELKKFLEKNSK